LKAVGQDNTSTNKSGFSALLTGARFGNGAIYGFGGYTSLWTSNEGTSSDAYAFDLYDNESDVDVSDYVKNYGYSVRCVKDSVE
jgi:uncharacterized protein (TIGR02145 family)